MFVSFIHRQMARIARRPTPWEDPNEAQPMTMDDRDLMRLRADVDFTYDDRGRMLYTNEPLATARRPAPRFFLGCTADGQVVRIGSTVPDDLARRFEAVVGRLRPDHEPDAALNAIRAILDSHTPVTVEACGPAYRFPTSIAPICSVIRLTDASRVLARETFPWLYDEIADWQPCYAVVDGGAAVSVCYISRLGANAAEAGVDTLPDFRGRGYATAVTAAWGMAVRESGRIPIYSTGWENRPSQGVARRLGLIEFGTDFTWT